MQLERDYHDPQLIIHDRTLRMNIDVQPKYKVNCTAERVNIQNKVKSIKIELSP
jgi:hypothetical protein